MLSNKAKYAIKAMFALARLPAGALGQARDIAEYQKALAELD